MFLRDFRNVDVIFVVDIVCYMVNIVIVKVI